MIPGPSILYNFLMRVAKLKLKQIMSKEIIFLPVAAKDMVQSWFSWDTTLMLWEFYILPGRVKTSTLPRAGWLTQPLVGGHRGSYLHVFWNFPLFLQMAASRPARGQPAETCLETSSSTDLQTRSIWSPVCRSPHAAWRALCPAAETTLHGVFFLECTIKTV